MTSSNGEAPGTAERRDPAVPAASAEPGAPPERRAPAAPAEPAAPARDSPSSSERVPRLPRGRGLRLSRVELVRIIGLASLLVFLIATQRPCANAVSKFVTSFGDRGSAAAVMPRPGTVDLPASASSAGSAGSAGSAAQVGSPADLDLDHYERLRPGMTEAETRAAIERSRARLGSGSAAPQGSATEH